MSKDNTTLRDDNPIFEITLHQIADIFRLGQLNVPRTATEYLIDLYMSSTKVKSDDKLSLDFNLLSPYSRPFYDTIRLQLIDDVVRHKLLTGSNRAEKETPLYNDIEDNLLIHGFAISDLIDAKMVKCNDAGASPNDLSWKLALLSLLREPNCPPSTSSSSNKGKGPALVATSSAPPLANNKGVSFPADSKQTGTTSSSASSSASSSSQSGKTSSSGSKKNGKGKEVHSLVKK